MPGLSKVWGYFRVNDKTGVCNICTKDIKLSKYKSTSHLWGHLKLFHPVEYENHRNAGVSNNSECSMCTTKGDIETGGNHQK